MAQLLAESHRGFVLLLESQGSVIDYVAVCPGFSLEPGGGRQSGES